jgi:hypothetical protein
MHRTKREAERERARFVTEVGDGADSSAKSTSVGEFVSNGSATTKPTGPPPSSTVTAGSLVNSGQLFGRPSVLFPLPSSGQGSDRDPSDRCRRTDADTGST